jgi:hypothetical protein
MPTINHLKYMDATLHRGQLQTGHSGNLFKEFLGISRTRPNRLD